MVELVIAAYPLLVWDRMTEYRQAGYSPVDVALEGVRALFTRTYMLLVLPLSLVATIPSAFGAALRYLVGDSLERYRLWDQRKANLEVQRPLRVKELIEKRR